MPGMTSTPSGPVRARSVATSSAEQTKPRIPASRLMRASSSTCSEGERSKPVAFNWAWSMLVSIVTASSSGGSSTPSRAARAAASMAGPPAAWTLTIRTPSLAAERTAPATVLGMSWNFRSRKTEWPRLTSGPRTAGPAAVNSSIPTLNQQQLPSSWPTRRAAEAASGTSRATMRRLRASSSGSTGRDATGQAVPKLGFNRSGMGISAS